MLSSRAENEQLAFPSPSELSNPHPAQSCVDQSGQRRHLGKPSSRGSLQATGDVPGSGQKFLGGSIKQDITVPIDRIPEFFARADAAVKTIVPGCRPVGFGHFGDGNIHYNIAQPVGADKAEFLSHWDEISEAVFDIVGRFDGSISAEHGIGIMKRETLARRADAGKMSLLRAVKSAIDPDNMMNPRVLI